MFKSSYKLCDLNGGISELKTLINSRIAEITELKNKASSDPSELLAIDSLVANVTYLSAQLYNSGFIVDPLKGRKYFLSDTRLLGGGAGYAKDVKNYKDYPLYDNKGNLDNVKKSVNYFNNARIANRQSRVYIVNNSKYTLYHKNHQRSSGFFFTDVVDAFGGPNRVIEPGGVGGFLSTKQQGTACGASGCFCFTVKTEGKNYVVCCGFSTSYSDNTNSAGVEIRGEDGTLDGRGCIAGHGIDATGNVTDVNGLMTKVRHCTINDKWQYFEESTRCFKINVKFMNACNNEFYFTISDN